MKNLLWLVAVLAAGAVYLKAGHWAMIAALMLMIVVHELGHWAVARFFGINAPVFSIGMFSSPRVVLFKLWGTEFQLTPWLFGGFVQIDPSDEDFVKRPAGQRLAVMVAGVVMNVLLAVGILGGLYSTMGERSVSYQGAVVQDFPAAASQARDAGLQAGDNLVAVDGKAVGEPGDLRKHLSAHPAGSPVDLTVDRAGTQMHVAVTPDKDGRIGVMLGGKPVVSYTRMNPLSATVKAVQVTYDMCGRMFYGIGAMMHIVPMPPDVPAGADEVHGVVAIVQMGDAALGNGIYSFVLLTALISINFAVMNILPIPVLDGGHIAYIGWEKLTGRPVPRKIQVVLSAVFMLLLMGLMVYGLVNDIVNPIKLG